MQDLKDNFFWQSMFWCPDFELFSVRQNFQKRLGVLGWCSDLSMLQRSLRRKLKSFKKRIKHCLIIVWCRSPVGITCLTLSNERSELCRKLPRDSRKTRSERSVCFCWFPWVVIQEIPGFVSGFIIYFVFLNVILEAQISLVKKPTIKPVLVAQTCSEGCLYFDVRCRGSRSLCDQARCYKHEMAKGDEVALRPTAECRGASGIAAPCSFFSPG